MSAMRYDEYGNLWCESHQGWYAPSFRILCPRWCIVSLHVSGAGGSIGRIAAPADGWLEASRQRSLSGGTDADRWL
jgi:hypothetical protein